jgi:hypothetical protein
MRYGYETRGTKSKRYSRRSKVELGRNELKRGFTESKRWGNFLLLFVMKSTGFLSEKNKAVANYGYTV